MTLTHLRRFAGIIVDIYYDYFLCRHWEEFSVLSLEDAVKAIHRDLKFAIPQAPVEAREVILEMINEEWLLNYQTISGIDETLNRVSYRSDVLLPIRGLSLLVAPFLDQMEEHFLEFYLDLVRYVGLRRAKDNR